MLKFARVLSTGALMAGLVVPALCANSNRKDDVDRINRSAEVFRAITSTPDKGIPSVLLDRAQCIAIVPGQKKFAMGIGGQYGKGLVTCRTANGWSAPLFITVGGGSWGLQLGGSSTDVVMVFLNKSGMTNMLANKFRIGADANAAAGPVGRSAEAGTDASLHAEILTYSRSRGAFAGVSLNGSVVQPDDSGNQAMYGNRQANEILSGNVPPPPAAGALVSQLSQYANAAGANSQSSATSASKNSNSSSSSSNDTNYSNGSANNNNASSQNGTSSNSTNSANAGTTVAPDNREQSNQPPNTNNTSSTDPNAVNPNSNGNNGGQPASPAVPNNSDETQPRNPQPPSGSGQASNPNGSTGSQPPIY